MSLRRKKLVADYVYNPISEILIIKSPFRHILISKHYNRRMEKIFNGLNNYHKVVHDVLIFDKDFNAHITRKRSFFKQYKT